MSRSSDGLKQRMTDYWTRRAAEFGALRLKEFRSAKHELWMRELRRFIPEGKGLRILDLGTGTGFFSFLLAVEGHQVTGIDMTPDMIAEAKETSRILGVFPEFFVMDAEKPEFPPESFDVLVTRNLTWSLPHLREAYKAWHQLLKPGGMLINFDGDYCREKEPEKLPANHAHKKIKAEMMAEYQQFKEALKAGQKPRPQWDEELLKDAGFTEIQNDPGVWRRIYGEEDEFYNPTPIFLLTARA